MTVHLIKLCVGAESIADLADWQARRLKAMRQRGQTAELVHITRHMPKRADEVLDGGSLYWVIKGFVSARQRLLELRPVTHEGIPHCGLVYDPELVPVQPRPHRPFQGWRYFDPKDAPPDLMKGQADSDMPESMRRELALLGLL